MKTPKDEASKKYPDLVKYHNVKLEDTYTNKDIEKAFVNLTKAKFAEKTQSSLFLANQVGNMYTPSVYSGLASLLINKPIKELAGTKVGVFSYGSGLCSSMYSITIAKQTEEGSNLMKLVSSLQYIKTQLSARQKVSPVNYTKVLEWREQNCHTVPFSPQSSITNMFPGTYYLDEVDEKYRRTYKRV